MGEAKSLISEELRDDIDQSLRNSAKPDNRKIEEEFKDWLIKSVINYR